MNKNNKILVGILTFVVVSVIGYALFSDNIKVTGTATAQGTFNVVPSCQTGIPSKLGTSYITKNGNDGGYKNDRCSINNNAVSLSTEFLYPEASRYFTVKVTNGGTINTEFKLSDIVATDKLCVADNLEGDNLTCSTTPNSSGTITLKGFTVNLYGEFAAMEDPNGNLLSQNELSEFYNSSTGVFKSKPGYSAYMIFKVFIRNNVNVTSGKMFVEYESKITMPFKQLTVN